MLKPTLNSGQIPVQLNTSITNFERAEGTPWLLQLADQQGVYFPKIVEITYLEADGNYTTVHFCNGESRVVCRTLRELEEKLEHCGFLRVHHSYLINLAHVLAYLREEGGTIVLQGGGKVYLSRSHRAAFFTAMEDRAC
ncbi:LytR/AlgR family response regulator transcription factor [Neolewinella xylanilytica]|uniref:LytR/AlgR family response regulator transcription factor n=1 Tax=Neolewinella xylanilytica TaxID=1514080 RepID=UPI000CEB07B3|nr:LytTR family DNA-binding domain-containing protein [Neolewinella xylanilytica]